jgi:hypothetical protein
MQSSEVDCSDSEMSVELQLLWTGWDARDVSSQSQETLTRPESKAVSKCSSLCRRKYLVLSWVEGPSRVSPSIKCHNLLRNLSPTRRFTAYISSDYIYLRSSCRLEYCYHRVAIPASQRESHQAAFLHSVLQQLTALTTVTTKRVQRYSTADCNLTAPCR